MSMLVYIQKFMYVCLNVCVIYMYTYMYTCIYFLALSTERVHKQRSCSRSWSLRLFPAKKKTGSAGEIADSSAVAEKVIHDPKISNLILLDYCGVQYGSH